MEPLTADDPRYGMSVLMRVDASTGKVGWQRE
jgi:hypothetical protein